MAVALARHFAAGRDRPRQSRIEVESAGTSAAEGRPITPQAAEALKIMGVPLDQHASRPLDRAMIERADLVVCMTPSHVAIASTLAPESEGKIRTLDPAGACVPDPIGCPQAVYTETCRLLADLIADLFKELDR